MYTHLHRTAGAARHVERQSKVKVTVSLDTQRPGGLQRVRFDSGVMIRLHALLSISWFAVEAPLINLPAKAQLIQRKILTDAGAQSCP